MAESKVEEQDPKLVEKQVAAAEKQAAADDKVRREQGYAARPANLDIGGEGFDYGQRPAK